MVPSFAVSSVAESVAVVETTGSSLTADTTTIAGRLSPPPAGANVKFTEPLKSLAGVNVPETLSYVPLAS